MRTPLLTLALVLASTAIAEPGPFVTASVGSAAFSSSVTPSLTSPRYGLSAGYAFSDLFAVDVSYFQTAEAKYVPDVFIHAAPALYGVEERQKISGFAFGPVFRWKLSDWVSVFTRQSYVSFKTDDVTLFNTGPTANRSLTTSGYQPSVGINFRFTKGAPFSVGLEVNHVLPSNDGIKMTSVFANLSYGF